MNSDSKEFFTVTNSNRADNRETHITPAMEDYLEMVFRLCKESNYTRVGKLADKLNVKPSSVSKMIKRLTAAGLLQEDKNDNIILTEGGRLNAEFLLSRHEIIETFLNILGIGNPHEQAEIIEHSISSEVIAEIRRLNDFFLDDPQLLERLRSKR